MRLLFIVDATSPIARNWMTYVVAAGHEVHVVSTVPDVAEIEGAKSLVSMPIGLNRMRTKSLRPSTTSGKPSFKASVARLLRAVQQRVPRERMLRMAAKSAQRDIASDRQQLRAHIEKISPDLVHAMRFPYEGCFAAASMPPQHKLLVSIWGNDFTLHAQASEECHRMTLSSLDRCDAIHGDCARDIRLARELGFPADMPALLVPGSGGVQRNLFHPTPTTREEKASLGIPFDRRIIIHPRGWRAYVRNDLFFSAYAKFARENPEVLLICPGMAGVQKVEQMVESLGLQQSVMLFGVQDRPSMAKLFRSAEIMVSPSEYDGTPNTLLEGMASGCFPVAGDIESVQEWITDGENGLLHPLTEDGILDALRKALKSDELRSRAVEMNQSIIDERAAYESSMQKAVAFYEQLNATPHVDRPIRAA